MIQQFGLANPVELRQPAAVPHHPADGDVALAVGAELRPVLGDRGVVVDQTAVGQPMDDRRGHPLGHRKHHRGGVGGPVLGAAAVRVSRPYIDDRCAVQVDGKCAATEPPAREQLGEGANRAAEAGVCRALYAVRERCAAVPFIDTRHNVLNLPGPPANKTGVTKLLDHCMSAASSSCCAASAGVSSPSRTWRSTSARILLTAGCDSTRSSTASRTMDHVQSTCCARLRASNSPASVSTWRCLSTV